MRYFMILFVFSVIFPLTSAPLEGSIKEETYKTLDHIRHQKKMQLLDYLEKIKNKADAIKTDRSMVDFFHLKNKYYNLRKLAPPPEALVGAIEELKKKINEHYYQNYLSFSDILFINKEGDIFYTIRKKADYHKNIFKGDLSRTPLAQQLRKKTGETFVDYHYYAVSDEPSSFIVEPVTKDGLFAGWFVLECSINKINNMFTQEEGLGTTGEVFLVNRDNYMLTDSRFYGESTVLRRHLSRKNIASKFRERMGHKIVTDYRGYRALTSFEVCKIADSEWLLIAKIDEDEVITEQWKKKGVSRQRFFDIVDVPIGESCDTTAILNDPVVVDMDAFRKAKNGEPICTFGVSTCTAVIVTFPGKFSYLGHISNLDRIYGGKTTDLINHMFKRIKTFDIYKYQLRALQVTVVANHFESIINVMDSLVKEGIFLSQIRFVHNKDAEYANLVLDEYVKNRVFVEWMMDKVSAKKKCQYASDVQSLGTLVKPLIGYE